MKRSIKSAASIAALGALLAIGVAPAAISDTPSPDDFLTAPELAGDFTIAVQEKKKRFNPKLIRSDAGTIKLTVYVPKSAKRKHGIGIDGGVYNDIDGAVVGPDRKTSITLDVEPGRYVVYDSYKNNRRKGFRTKLIVE